MTEDANTPEQQPEEASTLDALAKPKCKRCEAYEAAIRRELEHFNTNIKTLNNNELITLHNLNQIINNQGVGQ